MSIRELVRRVLPTVVWNGLRSLRRRAVSTQQRRWISRVTRDGTDIFTHHYLTNSWKSDESVSGPGSTLEYTENIRKNLPQLIADLDVATILDAPCGDHNWFRRIDWQSDITYVGGDIVAPLVELNRGRFAEERVSFQRLDIVKDLLPAADLWLCRDCLFHLSNRQIMLTFANFLRSDIRYLLTSTHTRCDHNTDIPTGSFRQLNLELAPFYLPPPEVMLDDWITGHPVRHLALWNRTSVQNALMENRLFNQVLRTIVDR